MRLPPSASNQNIVVPSGCKHPTDFEVLCLLESLLARIGVTSAIFAIVNTEKVRPD